MTFRRSIFWLHLLAGTIAGLVILVMSTTGVLLAFEAQIVDFAERSVRTVTPPAPGARRLSMDAVIAAARREHPDAMPTFLSMRAGPTAAVRVDLGRDSALFVDPYTADVVGPGSKARAVMHLIEDWHRWLGSRDVGRPITGACNAAFLVLCVTGVYLWWPRNWNRRTLRTVTWFTPRLRGRMRNWRWHNVIGFWCAPALVVITLTGVIMSYQWANDLLYTLTGNQPPPPVVAAGERVTALPGVGGARRPEAVGATGGRRPATVEALWARAEQQSPGWVVITLRLPPRSGGPVNVFIQEPATWHPTPRSLLTLDPLTAEVVKWEPYAAVNLGRTLRFWARPLHTGTAVGPIGQGIAALASAGGIMLVWTGVALAWRRFRAWLARSVAHRAPVKTPAPIVTSPIHQQSDDPRPQSELPPGWSLRRRPGERLPAHHHRGGADRGAQGSGLRPVRGRGSRRDDQYHHQGATCHSGLRGLGFRRKLRNTPRERGPRRPLGDSQLLYRLDAAYFHTDGFRDMENTTVEFLPKLAWTLTPNHKVRLDFDYRHYAITPDGYAIPFRGREILDVDRDTKYSTPFGRADQDVYGIRLVYEWTLSESLTWRNAVGILARDLSVLRNDAGTIAPGSIQMTGRSLRRHHQHTQDIDVQSDLLWKVATGPVRHTVLAGFEYLGQTRDYKLARAALPAITNVFDPVIPEQGLDGLRFVPLVEGTTQFDDFGAYLQDQIAFGAQWKARAGLRFDRFDTRDRNLVITAVGQRRYESRTDDELSWNAGIVYQPVPPTAFYGGASRSFVSSRLGFGARNSPPESATQFELGNKTTLLNGRISLNLALFYLTRENVVTFLPGEVLPVTEGKQRAQGLELDLASEPVRGWRLSANYAYTNAELVRLAPNDPSTGKGHRPTGVPENAGAVWTTYELQAGPLRGLGFGGGVRLKGEVFENTLNTQRIPGYIVADLVAFYRRGPLYVQVNVNNVANAKYFSGPTSETVGAVPGEPVSVLASVSIRY